MQTEFVRSIKKGNKIAHDEYHRFCDKALESKYFINRIAFSGVFRFSRTFVERFYHFPFEKSFACEIVFVSVFASSLNWREIKTF